MSALDFGDAGFNLRIRGAKQLPCAGSRPRSNSEDRQSFAIGGLLDNTENETFQKIPFLGDIPILGKFFQSMQRTKNNTELIVIVTPEIVSPVPAGTEIAVPSRPQPFLPPNSNTPMYTPDTAVISPPAAPATMPVEQLIETMKPETPLSDSGGYSGGGGGGGGGGGASMGGSSSPQ